MELKKVESGLIESIGYDGAAQTLFIRFKAKEGMVMPLFSYEPFDAHRWAAFEAESRKEGGSVGQYFHHNIKGDPSLTSRKLLP